MWNEAGVYRSAVKQALSYAQQTKSNDEEDRVVQRLAAVDLITIWRSLLQALALGATAKLVVRRQAAGSDDCTDRLARAWREVLSTRDTQGESRPTDGMLFRGLDEIASLLGDAKFEEQVVGFRELFRQDRNSIAHVGASNSHVDEKRLEHYRRCTADLLDVVVDLFSSEEQIAAWVDELRPPATSADGLPILRYVARSPGWGHPEVDWQMWTPRAIRPTWRRVPPSARLYNAVLSAYRFGTSKSYGVVHNLPARDVVHSPRKQVQDDLEAWWQHSRNHIQPITGKGGIGKTAEVLHWLHECLRRSSDAELKAILFYSAKSSFFDHRTGLVGLDYDYNQSMALLLERDLSRLHQVVECAREQVIVVIDNCETFESDEALLECIASAREKACVITTSRKAPPRASGMLQTISVRPFTGNALVSVVRTVATNTRAAHRGTLLNQIKNGPSGSIEERLADIGRRADGWPLKLRFALDGANDLDEVDTRLEATKHKQASELAEFLVREAWDSMPERERLLCGMLHHAAQRAYDNADAPGLLTDGAIGAVRASLSSCTASAWGEDQVDRFLAKHRDLFPHAEVQGFARTAYSVSWSVQEWFSDPRRLVSSDFKAAKLAFEQHPWCASMAPTGTFQYFLERMLRRVLQDDAGAAATKSVGQERIRAIVERADEPGASANLLGLAAFLQKDDPSAWEQARSLASRAIEASDEADPWLASIHGDVLLSCTELPPTEQPEDLLQEAWLAFQFGLGRISEGSQEQLAMLLHRASSLRHFLAVNPRFVYADPNDLEENHLLYRSQNHRARHEGANLVDVLHEEVQTLRGLLSKWAGDEEAHSEGASSRYHRELAEVERSLRILV